MEEITLNSQSIKTTIIDNIIFTAKSGNVEVSVDTENKIATISGGTVDISENFFQSIAGYTFKIDGAATINGIDYEGSGNVKFGESHWDVTVDKNFSVGNGSQSLGGLNLTATGNISFKLHTSDGTDSVTINGIKCSTKSDGAVSVTNGTINISGSVNAANFLKASKINTTAGGEINLLLAENDDLTFDGLKCEVTEPAVISIKDGVVTSTSGAFRIKTPNSTSLTLNGVTYTSTGDSSVSIDEGDANLTGTFKVKLGNDSVKLNKINVKGSAGTEFNFDSDGKNFVNSSDNAIEFSASYGKIFQVNGVSIIVDGEKSTAAVTKNLTTLSGNSTVGDGETSLSNKNFSVSSGEIIFKTLATDKITIDDATFDGSTLLTANFANTDAVKVEGAGVKIDGAGNFIIASTDGATINGTAFKSSTAYAGIAYNADDGYTLQTPFTIGDGTKNLNGLKISNGSIIKGSTFMLGTNDSFVVSEVTYSGDGEIYVDDEDSTKINLTGKISVDNSLNGKTYAVDDKADVTFSFDADDIVTINGKVYRAAENSATVTVKNGAAVMNGSFSAVSGAIQTYEFKQSSSVTDSQGVKYTATSTNAKITVDEENKKVKVSSGSVAITLTDEEATVKDYSFSIAQNSTAQINGVDFTQTGTTSNETNGDAVFTDDDAVTLNSPFTLGDGTQKLNGLKVTLATTANTIFNLGDNDSVTIITTGTSADTIEPIGDSVEGMTFNGTGTVNVSGKTISLNGTITVSGDAGNGYSFSLQAGSTYTFGTTAITVGGTGTVTVDGISGVLSGNLDSFNASAGTFTIGGTQFVTDGEVTFNLTDGEVSSIDGSGNVTITENGNSITREISGLISKDNTIGWESATFTVEAGATNEKHGNFTVTNNSGSSLEGNLTALNSMTLDDVTFAGTGAITVTADNITVGDGVTGTFTVDKTLGGITYGGVVDGQITSAGVTVHDISFSGTGSVDFTDATNFTASGVTFTIKSGMTVNGITYQGSDVSASAAADSLTIGGKTYSGTGTIASDGSVTGYVAITIGNGASITVNGIACTNGTGSNLEVTAITNGVTVGEIDFTTDGTGSLNFTSATNFTASGVNFTIANGMTVNGITYNDSGNDATTPGGALTIDGVTYDDDGTGTIEQNGVVTGNVTGTFNLANGDITAGGITFSGTGTGTVTSASVVINGVTYTGTGNVTVAENEISLDSGVNASFTLNGSDFTVNGITFQNSGAATATSSNVVIGGITYSGSGTVNADRSVAGEVTGTFNLTNGNFTVGGITYVGSGAAEISSEGVTIDGVTYGGTGGNVTISGDIITVSGSSVDVTASSAKTVNGYTVNGGITVANGGITALKEFTQVSKGSQVYEAQSDAAVTFDGDAKITVTSGTVNQTSGKFTFDGLEFTIASGDNATFTDGNLTSGGGTHTFANGETYTAYGKTYKPVDNNSKLQAVGDESAPYTTLNGTFEVTETVSTFEYDIYEYTATGDVTFRVTGDGSTKIAELTDKEVYNATGTRDDTTGIDYTVEASGNSYTITSGTYEIKITNGTDGGEKLKSATGIEQNFDSFKFGGVDYTGDADLTLNVSNFVATETFTSGYGQDGNGNYIIKGTAQIDGANYTASDGDLVTVTVTNDGGITNVSGGTLTIETSSSIKINGIDYEGTGTLTVSGAASVTVTDGSFTASGTFNNTSINGQSITIGGTNADEITLNVTPSAVTANSAGNGSFTINNEFFKVENDSEGGVTFTIQNGIVQSVSGINVDAQTNEPVKITIDDKVYKIRQTGKTLARNGDSWPEVSDNINAASYTVTFDGTEFTFTATDSEGATMTLDQDDFAFINGTALIIHETVTSAPITVVNESDTPITVGNVAGIGNGTIHLAGTTADNFTVGEGSQTYKITGGTFSVAGENVSLVGNGNFTVNGAAITISDSTDLNTLIFDGATVTGINPANGTITVATGTFAISGTTITVTGNTNATMTFTPNDYAISGISNDATVTLADTIPATLTINGIEVAGNITEGETIRFNSTSEVWTSGLAEAQSTDAYQIEIDDAGTIKLFYKATDGTFKQTKNISDYTAVFGDIQPDDDGGTLPTYSGGININSAVTDYVERITISKIGDYSVNNQSFTISSATTLKPLSESSIEISAPSNVVYDGMTISGGTAATLASDGITLLDGANVTNTNSSATFNVTGTVTFDGITLTGADSTQVTSINKDATSITINNQILNVTGDSTYNINLTDEKFSSVSNGAQIDGEFSNNKTISNDGAGTFTFYGQAFKAGGAVDFVTGSGNITAVNNLSSTLEGDFTTSIEINSQAVQVTNDTEIGVKGDGNGVTELYKLSGGANVQSFGGATKLSTDSEGQFTFGEGSCSVDDAQIYFTSDGNNINGAKDIDGGKSVVLYQAVTDFDIDGGKITTSQNDVTLKVDGSHVTGVENLTGEINGLTAGATVKVTGSSVQINQKALAVTGDDEVTVHATADGYEKVEGVDDGANFTTAENALIVTNGQGTFTFGSNSYVAEVNNNLTLKTGDSSQFVSVGGLANDDKFVVNQDEDGIYLGNNLITLSGAGTVTLTMGDNTVSGVENLTGEINGLTAGATVKVTGGNVTINEKTLSVTGDDEVTVHATGDGYEKVEGVDDGANFTTAENALIVTNGQGTFTFGSNSYVAEVDNNLTLKTGDSSQLVSVGGLASDDKFVVNQDEDGIYLGNNLITLTGAGTVSLTMGDNTVSGVENLTGEIDGLTAGATVKVTGNNVTINEKSLAVTGDDEVTVHATGDGYGTIEGLTGGAQVTAENSTLVTDSEGTFTFQSNVYAVGGDDEVVFVTNENGALTKVESLTSGTVSGNFADGITVDGKSIQISSDDEVSVLADENSAVKSIHAINSNAVVQSASNVSLVTAEDGTFNFNDGHQFDLTNNNSAVTLSTGNNSNVTAISGISSGSSVAFYADETININGKAVTVKGVTSQLTFEMGSNDTISAVNELLDGNEVDGLSSGALVTVTGENTTINGAALTSNQAVTVYASSGGYGTVTGFSSNVNITAKNTSLVTDSRNGSFTFGGKDYEIADNEGDDNITLKTDADGYVTALDNLDEGAKLIISQSNDFTLNGKHLEIGGATSESRATLTMGGGNTVSAVENLKGDINGLSQGALVTVTTGDNIKINGHNLKIDEGSETNYVVKVKSGGYSEVTGLSNGAQVTTEDNVYFVTNEEGTFTFANGDYIITGDNEVTLKTDDRAQGILTTFDGLTGTLQTPSHYNTINGAALYCDDTNISIVAVEGGISSIIGFTGGKLTMPSGTDVSIKSDDKTETINATINGNTYNLIGDDNGLEIHGNKIIGLNADARLTVGAAGTYTVNGAKLTIDDTLDASLRVFVGEMINGEDAASARLYQEGDINFGDYTPADEIATAILGEGEDTNDVVVVDDDDDDKTVTLDDTKKLAIIKVDGVEVTTNSDVDTVVSSGNNVAVDANDNAATIVPLGGTMNLTSAENSVIQLTNADIVAAIRDKAITFDYYNDNVTVNLSNGAKVTYSGDYVNFKNTGGTEYKFAYLSDTDFNPGTNDGLLLYSNPSSERTITTGSGDDTAFVNAGDVVNLGAGSNCIEISSERNSSSPAQIISTLESSASTTVKGFKANDLEDGDIAKFKSVDNTTVTYSGSELTFTSGRASLKMIDTDNGDFINVRITDESNVTLKTSVAQAGKAITVPATDNDEFASVYVGGDGSGVDLSDFEDTVSVDLNTNSGKFGEADVVFRDIHSIKGGTAEHTLIGAEGLADTLMAGTGAATIRGAGWDSDDVLIGNSDQTTLSTFIYEVYDGNDTLKSFQFYKATQNASSSDAENNFVDSRIDTNNDTADVLRINQDRLTFLNSIEVNRDNVVLGMSYGSNSLTIEKARGEKMKFVLSENANDTSAVMHIAKIDTDVIIYDGVTDYYLTTGAAATVSVAADFLDNEEENAEGERNKGFIALTGKVNGLGNQEIIMPADYTGSIIALDASAVTQSVSLTGNDGNNTIKAGDGGCALWGSDEGNDVLIGGAGEDSFWYGLNNEHDTIEGYGAGDLVNCFNMATNDISSVVTTNGNVVLTTRFSHSLTIKYENDVSDITFKDSSGDSHTYNILSKSFS